MQLAILRQGVEAWNAWRKENPNVLVCLSHQNLSDADLRQINLNGADLVRAILTRANLTGAELNGAHLFTAGLNGANLTGAKLNGAELVSTSLTGANLTEAGLVRADLAGAILTGANLTQAKLNGANLTQANFTDADLAGVVLSDTVLANLDLSRAKGLEACDHRGPSIIDHRTLQQSGELPLSFLRGCGLPDNLIEYLPSLLNQPIQFYSCFISYSAMDGEFAQRLHADLQNEGIRCWFAPEDMKIGDRIRTRIDEVIRLHEKLLLILSANSINSGWVEKEVETAFEKEQENKSSVLFPVRLDDAIMHSKSGWAADIKRTRHIGDFRRWKGHDDYRHAFERLLRDLRVEPAI